MQRWLRVVPLAVAVAGVAVALTVGSLVGAALVIGAGIALLVLAVPAVVEFFVRWLSTGRVHHRGL